VLQVVLDVGIGVWEDRRYAAKGGEARMRNRAGRLFGVLVVIGAGVGTVAPPAGATPAPVTISLSLDRSSIRADGRDVATLQVDATSGGTPVAGASVRVFATWTTLSTGAATFHTAPFLLDGAGHVSATVTSTRSGTMTIVASIHSTTYLGSASIGLDARRRSIVVFASGASSVVSCPTPTTCGDPLDLFNPVRSALAAQGFSADDMPTFSYAGGTIDPLSHQWVPYASTCAQSATSYKTEVGRMRSMLRKIAYANPNSDLTLVGVSQGGLLVFQMIGAQKATLPKGGRLVNVISLDGAVGGAPLAQILNLEHYAATSCWSLGGVSKAAQQIVALWNTTSPTQGPQQADRATIMCNLVGFLPCVAQTNEQAVAVATGINVQTWGSSQDGVFDPPVCGIPGAWVDARDTQTVTGAGGGQHAEGGVVTGSFCPLSSHIAVIANRASGIAATVGAQQ
jgi:hypothetical protein